MKTVPSMPPLIEGFPIPKLTKIVGKPNCAAILKIDEELKKNAASVRGNHGHLRLLMTPAECTQVSYAPFTRPAIPVLSPITPVGGTKRNVKRAEYRLSSAGTDQVGNQRDATARRGSFLVE